jgi:hypothetical protein
MLQACRYFMDVDVVPILGYHRTAPCQPAELVRNPVKPKSSSARLFRIVLVALGLVAPSSGQILGFLPVTDSIIVSGLNDVPPALIYSVDTSSVGVDSIKIVSAVAMYASSVNFRRSIPYCTFIVRDSNDRNEYTLWLLRDPPATPGRILMSAKQFTGLWPGKGYLSLVVSVAGKPLDSLRVRCIVDIANSVVNQDGHSGNTRLQLMQNYPNPFNPVTSISYQLPGISFVKLAVCDVLGQEVAALIDEVKQPGTYTVIWDASGVPSGTYFYRLQAGEFVETKKMILLK